MTKNGKERFEEKFGEQYHELNADINVTFNKRKSEFKEFYAQNVNKFEVAKNTFQNLFSLLVRDLETGAPKILARIKDREECIRKFEIKYRNKAEKKERATKLRNIYI